VAWVFAPARTFLYAAGFGGGGTGFGNWYSTPNFFLLIMKIGFLSIMANLYEF
jgi:hypothetical protein